MVVDGNLIISSGIDLQNKLLEVQYYRVCSLCNRVQIAQSRTEISPTCTSCGKLASGKRSKTRGFVVPRGFTTRIDEPVKEVRLNRLKAPPNSEVFLVEGAHPDSFTQHSDLSGISLGYSPNGKLFRANSGRKFQAFKICTRWEAVLTRFRLHTELRGGRSVLIRRSLWPTWYASSRQTRYRFGLTVSGRPHRLLIMSTSGSHSRPLSRRQQQIFWSSPRATSMEHSEAKQNLGCAANW